MDENSIIPVVDHLQGEFYRHVAENKQRFSDIEETLNWLSDKSPRTEKETIMSDGVSDSVKIHNAPGADPSAAMMMAAMANKSGDGLFGGGGGLLGGLLLGSLLRNNGGLFGGGGDVAVATQPQANMSIMSTLGDIKQSVAVGTAQMEASQAQQSGVIQGQLSSVAAALTSNISGVKDSVNSNTVALMQMLNGISKDISNDGEKTRALVVNQYEQTLNRQLSDANAQVVELRSELNGDRRVRNAEINVTQNVNQNQQQQQWQELNNRVVQLLAEHQNIRQGIINLGTMSGSAGQQTAANTRVN